MKYDLLVYNANIHTLCDDISYSNMLIKDEKVVLLEKEKYLGDDINLSKDIDMLFNAKGQMIIPAFYIYDEDIAKLIMSILANYFPGKAEKKDIVYITKEISNMMVQNGIVAVRPINSVMDKDEKFAFSCFNKFYTGGVLDAFLEEKQRVEKEYNKEEIKRILDPFYNMREMDEDISIKNIMLSLEDIKIWGEEKRGKLGIGYQADFITIDGDIFDTDISKITNIQVISSFLGGRDITPKRQSRINLE